MKLNHLLLCTLLTAACQSEKEYIIEGTLPQPFTGKVYLTCVKDRYTRIDSVTLNAETNFKLKVSLKIRNSATLPPLRVNMTYHL